MSRLLLVTSVAVCAVPLSVSAAETEHLSAELIQATIRKAIPTLENASAGSADKRKCFTCHHQSLPILALVAVRDLDFPIDETNLKRQIEHTASHLKRGQQNYLEGKGQGGRVLTAGYALRALDAADYRPDEITSAVSHFLIDYQQKQGFWHHPGQRPPSSGSAFATTYVALAGLRAFGTGEQQKAINVRLEAVRSWLRKTQPEDTEDQVFRLRSLELAMAPPDAITAAAGVVLEAQRDNGGWAQTEKMSSDVYATATALTALLRSGHLNRHAEQARKAAGFLIRGQQKDGSWHVVTRAKGFQTYFETGYPHG
ncbi:MAG: prenyltransferase/squalene oxidase repeat-containing protein, partial [Planctomycetaceae bacterium]